MAPLRARAGYFRLYGAGRTTVLPSIVTAPATSAAPASALPFTTVPLTSVIDVANSCTDTTGTEG